MGSGEQQRRYLCDLALAPYRYICILLALTRHSAPSLLDQCSPQTRCSGDLIVSHSFVLYVFEDLPATDASVHLSVRRSELMHKDGVHAPVSLSLPLCSVLRID